VLESKKKVIEDELKSIVDKTWKGSLSEEAPNMQLTTYRPQSAKDKRKARFDPSVLLSIRSQDDLEQWISEIQLKVDLFGEEPVCLVL